MHSTSSKWGKRWTTTARISSGRSKSTAVAMQSDYRIATRRLPSLKWRVCGYLSTDERRRQGAFGSRVSKQSDKETRIRSASIYNTSTSNMWRCHSGRINILAWQCIIIVHSREAARRHERLRQLSHQSPVPPCTVLLRPYLRHA
jgi:hypothetical protein